MSRQKKRQWWIRDDKNQMIIFFSVLPFLLFYSYYSFSVENVGTKNVPSSKHRKIYVTVKLHKNCVIETRKRWKRQEQQHSMKQTNESGKKWTSRWKHGEQAAASSNNGIGLTTNEYFCRNLLFSFIFSCVGRLLTFSICHFVYVFFHSLTLFIYFVRLYT